MTGIGDVVFALGLKNYGQTPAYKVNVSVHAVLLPFPTKDIAPPSANALSNVTLGPGTDHAITVSRTAFNETEIADLASARALYVHGIVEYVDAFKKKRVTAFRFVKGGGPAYSTAGVDLYSANEGNEAN